MVVAPWSPEDVEVEVPYILPVCFGSDALVLHQLRFEGSRDR